MARKSKSAMSAQKVWEEKISRAKQVKKNWKDLFKVQLALEYLDGKQRPSTPTSRPSCRRSIPRTRISTSR